MGGGGCFGSTALVTVVRDGVDHETTVAEVQPGDEVRVAGGGTARVRCVTQTAHAPTKDLYNLPNGLVVTGTHPTRIDGVWRAPKTLGLDPVKATAPIYDFVLDSVHIIIANGFECATMGHGFTEEGVGHPYYGTERVIDDLKTFAGWAEGRVVFSLEPMKPEAAQPLPSEPVPTH
eukprot:NODE_984_length_704_cov_773.760305_g767_i0.p1 GENE.NODE_984_length_704_cov_773.760305_g767_i0~~NODE_984_length_704_cov_773.760305_g767_i0.p1  ORF type:complete len:185 (+),score=36.65 NODE_984_length_704_cov_773.760305_g767_i0:30-557(+)